MYVLASTLQHASARRDPAWTWTGLKIKMLLANLELSQAGQVQVEVEVGGMPDMLIHS